MKKRIFSLLGGALMLVAVFAVSSDANAQILPPPDGGPCAFTYENDGGETLWCEDGTYIIYSRSTPIGGCAGAYLDCRIDGTWN